MHTLDRLLESIVGPEGLPSASLVVQVGAQERYQRTLGLANLASARPAAPDQAYDLASLTKPLVGASVSAALLAQGLLALDRPVAEVIPGVPSGITAAHLLTHSSGYPAWRPLYQAVPPSWGSAATRRALLAAAQATPLEAAPGAQHRYSDLGFLVLLDLLERLGGAPIDQLFARFVLAPLGEEELRWGWPCAAATEDCPIRGQIIEGTVHDLNCAAMGGRSSHAGLFGTARGVARLARALLEASRARGPLAHLAIADLWALRGAGTHVGGWDTPSPGASSAGRHFPPDSVGHLGYTGTSLWIAPSHDTLVVLLTNRVHPRDDLTLIRAARPSVHDAVAAALAWPGATP